MKRGSDRFKSCLHLFCRQRLVASVRGRLQGRAGGSTKAKQQGRVRIEGKAQPNCQTKGRVKGKLQGRVTSRVQHSAREEARWKVSRLVMHPHRSYCCQPGIRLRFCTLSWVP